MSRLVKCSCNWYLSAHRLQIVNTNRLILNLIHGANAREDSEFRTRTGLEPPTFATGPYLGNIGGPVRTLPDDFDDELEQGDDGTLNTGELESELGGESGARNIRDRDGLGEAGPSTSRLVGLEIA